MRQGSFILAFGLVAVCILWRRAQAQQVVYSIVPRPASCPLVPDYGANGLNLCYDGTLYFWNGAGWAAVVSGAGSVPSGAAPQIVGYTSAHAAEAETVSKDCTFTRTGANAYSITCTTAGGGMGNFQAGILGVGTAPVGVAGDISAFDGIGVGNSSSLGTAGAGNINLDNTLLCVTNNVPCITQNTPSSGALTMAEVDSSGIVELGSNATSGQQTRVLGGANGSVTITAGGFTETWGTGGIANPNNSGNAFRLTTGAVESMTGGTKPTCSSATGTCTVTTGSTDNRGQLVLAGGMAVTQLTLTFNHTWPQAPFCLWTDSSQSTTPPAYSGDSHGHCSFTTSCIVDFAAVSAASVNYLCF